MVAIILAASLFLSRCTPEDRVTIPDIDISGSPNGIVEFPEGTSPVITDVFTRYTKIMAPNGKPIHFVAQGDWSDDKLIKAIFQLLTYSADEK